MYSKKDIWKFKGATKGKARKCRLSVASENMLLCIEIILHVSLQSPVSVSTEFYQDLYLKIDVSTKPNIYIILLPDSDRKESACNAGGAGDRV